MTIEELVLQLTQSGTPEEKIAILQSLSQSTKPGANELYRLIEQSFNLGVTLQHKHHLEETFAEEYHVTLDCIDGYDPNDMATWEAHTPTLNGQPLGMDPSGEYFTLMEIEHPNPVWLKEVISTSST